MRTSNSVVALASEAVVPEVWHRIKDDKWECGSYVLLCGASSLSSELPTTLGKGSGR